MVGIQNSILVLNSSDGFKIQESLKGTNLQSIAFDPLNPVYHRPCVLWYTWKWYVENR